MATTVPATHQVSLESIRIPTNVREVDPDHVDVLARSIALQRMLCEHMWLAATTRRALVALTAMTRP